MKRICVNCGSGPGFDSVYLEMARKLGNTLVSNHLKLVYGGAEVGLMGEVANTVLQAGGTVIGVLPRWIALTVPCR